MTKEPLYLDDCTEKVIRYYSDMVYRIAFSRTGTKYDADEIFQEVFLRYIKNSIVFTNEEHRKAWLIKVSINCSKTLFNSPWRKKVQPLDDSLNNNLIFELEEEKNLFHELQKLSPKYRNVIHLFYYEDMSINEISNVLGLKASTVRAQLCRGRQALKSFMKEEDYV